VDGSAEQQNGGTEDSGLPTANCSSVSLTLGPRCLPTQTFIT